MAPTAWPGEESRAGPCVQGSPVGPHASAHARHRAHVWDCVSLRALCWGAVMGARRRCMQDGPGRIQSGERQDLCPLTLNVGQCSASMKAVCPGSFYSSREGRAV